MAAECTSGPTSSPLSRDQAESGAGGPEGDTRQEQGSGSSWRGQGQEGGREEHEVSWEVQELSWEAQEGRLGELPRYDFSEGRNQGVGSGREDEQEEEEAGGPDGQRVNPPPFSQIANSHQVPTLSPV